MRLGLISAALGVASAFVVPGAPAQQARVAVALPRCVQTRPLASVRRSDAVRMQQGGRGGSGGFDPQSLVGPAVLIALIGTGTLGWLFNLLNGFFLLLFIVPLVAGPAVSWFIEANAVEGACPECGAPMKLLKMQQQERCYSCGALMSSEISGGVFMRTGGRTTEDGVVEVDVTVDD